MAVRTDNFALSHLVEHVLPPPFREVLRDLESFLAFPINVIEVEHDWVGLSAIDARMDRDVLEKKKSALNPTQFLLEASLLDVPVLVRQVMLSVIRRVAGAAHVVPLALCLAPPREGLERLALAASPA